MLNLNDFMNKGIKNISDTARRYYLGNRQGQAFMLHMISSLRKSAKTRSTYEQSGIHIPPFLICSIASSCNLCCVGCYARANGGCDNAGTPEQMSSEDWQRVFSEASEIGISFILLAGGEPLIRREIIEQAAKFDNIIFPIFTNGTMIDEEYMALFDQRRNLIPVLSIEGDAVETDKRRGEGVSEKLFKTADIMKEKGILFGVSITVTTENKDIVTESSFINNLKDQGCGLVFFVEYVPAEPNTNHLVLDDTQLKELQEHITLLRNDKSNRGMILLSFPGDEEAMGGCLAAGRGFFHINANGGAEPCPFSPFSEVNVREQSLEMVLQSEFFAKVREISAAEVLNHKGGCTLFQYEEEVKQALR